MKHTNTTQAVQGTTKNLAKTANGASAQSTDKPEMKKAAAKK
jgi:hypothetical protein